MCSGEGRALRTAQDEWALYEPHPAEPPVRTLVMSSSERVALGVGVALLALHASGVADLLQYQRDALAQQPWRFLTGHVVHLGWAHVAINAAALWLVARLYAIDLSAVEQALVLVASALATSSTLFWIFPEVQWYRGLSGALHGLYFAGAATWLLTERPRTPARLWMPVSLFAGGWIKVVVEQPARGALPAVDWLGGAVVPQAHLAGAVCGTLLGALIAAAKVRAEQQRAEQ
jgi:rhomboid family GlyGly-CTERM serine protease